MSGPTLDPLCILSISLTGPLPSAVGLSRPVRLSIRMRDECPQPRRQVFGLASSPFARRYLENRCFFLFLRVLRCFSSPGCLLTGYVFTCGCSGITLSEFPHSEICGSTDICSSPQLFAACHVLLRLPVPRHPPYALLYLTCKVHTRCVLSLLIAQ